jgi:predicted SnoaL-like aldol condensation-catalyzing enzyme
VGKLLGCNFLSYIVAIYICSMDTYKERGIHLPVLSIDIAAMFIASFASYAHSDFANAQPNNRTSIQPQRVQSTQELQNTTVNNYTGLEEKNKALVLEGFNTLFNQRDYVAAERYWSPNYIQHSAHIEPGREGLFNLVKSSLPTLKYEPGTIVADGDFVIVHGKFSGLGQPVNWIAADILYIKDGVMVEHWDVIQDEASQEQSKSGLPMFGDKFPNSSSRTN